MKMAFALLVLLCSTNIEAQHTIIAKICYKQNNMPLQGASFTISKINKGDNTNINGIVILTNLPSGIIHYEISHIGFNSIKDSIFLPQTKQDTIRIFLSEIIAAENDDDVVIVTATRTSRSIANNPSRVEVIAAEELDEKSNMRPSNVAMVLHESTGIQVQQTSATSGNASIRVQGLDGRYTQLLKDGYPNYGNFASGLSILEIPPLDFKQVEIIKGSASTLYGGGAIAGVINFVSKTPTVKGEHNFIINQSNIGQTNIGAYSSKKYKKFGYAILGLYNQQRIYDVDKDSFTEVPKGNGFTVSPRLFFYPNENTTILLGNSITSSKIMGGDVQVLKGNSNNQHTYFENNETTRNTTTLQIDRKTNNGNCWQLKQSIALFNRTIAIPNYTFKGKNSNAFTDLSYTIKKEKATIVIGSTILLDKFKQKTTDSLKANTNTIGVYSQATVDINDYIKIEAGLRIDALKYSGLRFTQKENFLLPRLATVIKLHNKLSSRIGIGLGYKTPTIFTEQTETLQYQNVQPLQNVTAEKSLGITADLNYRTAITDALSFTANQLFFATKINRPLILQQNKFSNATSPTMAYGFETNLRFAYKDNVKLFVGYTYNIAKGDYLGANNNLPLVPQNRLNLISIYEKEDNFKLGLEAYFTDRQWLSNGTKSFTYWELGFMAEKTIKEKFAIYINFENFTDTRQSHFKRVVNGTANNPIFDEIWTHTEGFVWNSGIKIKL